MIMIYSVCALFIDEVYFHDTTNSNGIIIDRVPPRKKVSAQRKCFYCDRLGKCFNLDHKVDAVTALPSSRWPYGPDSAWGSIETATSLYNGNSLCVWGSLQSSPCLDESHVFLFSLMLIYRPLTGQLMGQIEIRTCGIQSGLDYILYQHMC